MTERERSNRLRHRVVQEARLGMDRPAVSPTLHGLLSDVLVELDRLAGIVDAARAAVGSTP